jgi:hypothetical protein
LSSICYKSQDIVEKYLLKEASFIESVNLIISLKINFYGDNEQSISLINIFSSAVFTINIITIGIQNIGDHTR